MLATGRQAIACSLLSAVRDGSNVALCSRRYAGDVGDAEVKDGSSWKEPCWVECGAVDGVKEERNWSWLVRCSWQDEETRQLGMTAAVEASCASMLARVRWGR